MTAPSGFGFPGTGAPLAPGGAPQAMQPQVGFVLDIPPDPSWEPFESADVLDKDGYYQCRISKESSRTDSTKSAGIFLTMEIQDEDTRGKILSRFLPDPRTAKGNVWWIWRGLLRSITGTTDGGKQGLRYTPGMFTNQLVYVKTDREIVNDRLSTSIDSWITAPEWQEAVRTNRHRWPPKAVQQGGNVGALPGGLPGGFPGLPGAASPGIPMGGGLPGAPAPALPIAQSYTPQPSAAPPMQQAPVAQPQQTFSPPPPQQTFAPPQQTFTPPPAAAPAAPSAPQPGQPFTFASFPGMSAPPPVNGAPPATAAGIVSAFPGMPTSGR